MRSGYRRPATRLPSPLAIGAGLTGVVLLALAFLPGGAPAVTVRGSVGTPLWSLRRAPEPVTLQVGAQRLQAALASTAGPTSCFAAEFAGTTVASGNAATPFIGASTQKLFTAASALAVLGPDRTLDTRVVAPAAPANGTVERLWLIGSGDPGLATADYDAFLDRRIETRDVASTSLEALADAIVAKGVRRVPGGVVGDDSRFDAQRYLPTWRDVYRTDGTVGPMGALVVNDGYRTWEPRRAADDPALEAAAVLTRLLQARAVDVGPPSRGVAPTTTVAVAEVRSAPIATLVASVLRSSDNLGAELLTKAVGAQAGGAGTTVAGTRVALTRLGELGVPVEGVALVDGSGLDRANRVTCQALVATMALGSRPGFGTMNEGLSVAGRDGTLGDRLRGTPLDGRLRAKTGSLQGVTGLVGFIDGPVPMTFAFVANGDFSEAAGMTLRERVAAVVDGYPQGPVGATVVLPPVAPITSSASRTATGTG